MMLSSRAVGLLLLVGLATACHDAPSQEAATVTRLPVPAAPNAPPPAPPTTTPPAAPCRLPVYPLERLGQQLGASTRLSSAAVKQWQKRHPRLPALWDEYGEGQDLHVVDTLKCARYTLVTMFYRHEDCCDDLYY